jgi:hypothetical protein
MVRLRMNPWQPSMHNAMSEIISYRNQPLKRIAFPLFFLAGFLLPRSSWAAEPSEVLGIRKECNAIDKQLSHWKRISADEACQGESCADSTIYIDLAGKVRKIEMAIEGNGPANSKDHFNSNSTYYFDDKEQGLFCFVKSHAYLESANLQDQPSENRYYFRNDNLVAWKKNDIWAQSSDAKWQETAATVRKEIGGAPAILEPNVIRSMLTYLRLPDKPPDLGPPQIPDQIQFA